MQQLKKLQAALNALTVKCVAVNKTVSDIIEVKSAPSVIPSIDLLLEATLIKKMTLQLDSLADTLDDASALFEEAFCTNE